MIIRKVIISDTLDTQLGSYSYGVWAGDTLYLSGVLGITNDLRKNPDIKLETESALNMAELYLKAAGLTLENVVSVRIYLKNISDFKEMEGVYRTRFVTPYPARATVAVSDLAADANIEIVLTAFQKNK